VNKKAHWILTKIQWACDDWIFTLQTTGVSDTCLSLYDNGFGLSITIPDVRENRGALAKQRRNE